MAYSTGDSESRRIISIIQDERVAGGGLPFSRAEKDYVHTIVCGSKYIGTWNKKTACYGMVGGTAASHKWNWKDMRDLNAAYRLVFTGGVHNSNGWVGNSSNRFANTFINVSSLNVNSCGFGIYSNSLETSTAVAVSDIRNNAGNYNGLLLRTTNTVSLIGINTTTNNLANAPGNLTGFTLTNKINTSHIIYNKGIITSTSNSTITSTNNGGVYSIGGLPVNSDYYTNKSYQLIMFHNGFTETEALQESNLIRFAEGILNRH